MADVHGSPSAQAQNPSASGPGPAPVPFPGGNQPADGWSVVTAAGYPTMGPQVMDGVSGAMGVQESGYAHDVNGYQVTPYYAGDISPVNSLMSGSMGDDVSGTVAGAVAAAEGRFTQHELATHGTGNDIGDLMDVPANSLDAGVGTLGPEGGFYDPPRNY